MPNYTSNYGLVKPLPTELYNVEVQNENMDKIDDAICYKKLLWENASPTSSFEPQTITLDLSQYKQIEIIFKAPDANSFMSWNAEGFEIPMVLSVGSARAVSVPRLGGDRIGNAIVISSFRYVNVKTDGIDFDHNWGMTGAGYAAMGIDNTCFVPLKIYGIKGV